MIRLLLFSLLPILLLFSCAPKEEFSDKDVPVSIIQPDSMVELIVDMQLTEAVLREYRMIGKYDDSIAAISFEQVFIKHNITREKYEESITFYKKNLETYESIYEEVITRLSLLQSEISAPEIDDYE